MQSAVHRVLRIGRATMLAIGVGVSLALILGVATVALAAVPGDPFRLGRVNVINNAATTLQGSGPSSGGLLSSLLEVKRDGLNRGPALRVQNTSTQSGATGVRIEVPQGKAPISVNPKAGKAFLLNADELDGEDRSDFMPSDTYVVEGTEFGSGGGREAGH